MAPRSNHFEDKQLLTNVREYRIVDSVEKLCHRPAPSTSWMIHTFATEIAPKAQGKDWLAAFTKAPSGLKSHVCDRRGFQRGSV